MARAYIVVARNDLPNNLLQVADLDPHEQERTIYDGSKARPYQTHFARDAAVNTAVATAAGAGGGASLDTTTVTYGLAAYLIDHVEDQVANAALTSAVAIASRTAILARVAAGQALDGAGIAAALIVGGAGAGTTLTAAPSTGVVEEVLRILAGEVWRLPAASQVTTAAGAFDATVRGGFVARPSVELPDSVRTTQGIDRALRGRKSTANLTHLRPGEPLVAAVQTGLQDVLFRDAAVTVDTGHLSLSAATGMLAELKATTYSFTNTAFTYAGGATPAQTIAGVNIAATHQARAVVVYSATGVTL